jgi:hypothetical protein
VKELKKHAVSSHVGLAHFVRDNLQRAHVAATAVGKPKGPTSVRFARGRLNSRQAAFGHFCSFRPYPFFQSCYRSLRDRSSVRLLMAVCFPLALAGLGLGFGVAAYDYGYPYEYCYLRRTC